MELRGAMFWFGDEVTAWYAPGKWAIEEEDPECVVYECAVEKLPCFE